MESDVVIDVNNEDWPESDSESDMDNDVNELEINAAPQLAEQLAENAAVAQQAADAVDAALGNEAVEAQQLPAQGADNPHELYPRAEVLDALRQVLRENMAEASRNRIILDSAKYRYFAAALGIISALNASHALYAFLKGGGSIFRAVHVLTDNVSSEDSAQAQTVAAWKMKDEATFWQLLSNFVTVNAPRPVKEQLLFLQFSEDIGAHYMSGLFTWNSADEKITLIQQMCDVITSKGLAQAYLTVPTLNHAGAPLPRAVAANVMAMALVQWMNNSPKPT